MGEWPPVVRPSQELSAQQSVLVGQSYEPSRTMSMHLQTGCNCTCCQDRETSVDVTCDGSDRVASLGVLPDQSAIREVQVASKER